MAMKANLTVILTASAMLLAASLAQAAQVDATKLPPPANKQGVTFSNDIKPIFSKSCVGCHGPEKAKGRIRLDSAEGALKGSGKAKIIEPGDSAKSKLVHAVARLSAEPMPPKDKAQPLTPEQVGLIRAWIDQGAK